MAWLFKLLITSGLAAGPLRARIRAAIRNAGAVAALAVLTMIALAIGAVAIAVTAFLALRASLPDYQAALIVGGIFIGLAGISGLAVASKIGSIFNEPERPCAPLPVPGGAPSASSGDDIEAALARLLVAGLQSPIVSALALGIAAGRMTKRPRRE